MAESSEAADNRTAEGDAASGLAGERTDDLSNGPTAVNGQAHENFLQARALSQDDPLLSPSHAPHFDVDSFLVSRSTGSTLNEIVAELQMFGGKLRHELDEVVDRDFRGFVNLGVALRAERPRISRLDWRGTDARRSVDGVVDRRYVTSNGADANLGLENVRSELLVIRDGLRREEERIRLTMAEKENVEKSRANLQVLVTLNESLGRLENMLISGAAQLHSDPDVAEDVVTGDAQQQFWHAFEKQTYEEPGKDDDSDGMSSFSDLDADVALGGDERIPRKSIAADEKTKRRRSSLPLLSASLSEPPSSAKSSLMLPDRIQRASSEYSALMFLAKQATSLGFEGFVKAHKDRITSVELALKRDLSNLVETLSRYEGSSLLVPGLADRGAENAEIRAWSRIPNGDQGEKRAEQSAWLRLALSTWLLLQSHDTERDASEVAEAEAEIRRALITPWCEEHISSAALQKGGELVRRPEAPEGQLSDDLAVVDGQSNAGGAALIALYNSILEFVKTHTSQITAIAEEVVLSSGQTKTDVKFKAEQARALTSRETRFEVFVHSVWREIATRLMERIGGQLFFVGRPDDFRVNYTISLAFLDCLQGLAPTPRAAAALRQDEVYATFKKRWQLPVYFQMRFRDIVTTFETGVQSTAGDQSGVAPSPITEAAIQAFVSPWIAKSHIMELSHRQWRLSLQMVSRYKTWIMGELPNEVVPAHRRAPDVNKPQSAHTPFEQQQRFSGATQSMTNSPTRAGTPTGNDVDQENQLMDSCTALSIDALHFEAKVQEAFQATIVPAVLGRATETDKGSEEIVSGMRDALNAALSSVTSQVVPPCAAKVTSILKSRSAEPLRLVRSVSTQYRTAALTGTAAAANGTPGAPVEPSFFVIQFLRPVRQYLGTHDKAQLRGADTATAARLSVRLPKQIRVDWIGEVIEDFVIRYTASLNTMSKNFESLQRLKRVNAAGAEPSGTNLGSLNRSQSHDTSSESDRMYAQMMADVDHFEREVHELGGEVDTRIATETPAWSKLKAAARGERLDD